MITQSMSKQKPDLGKGIRALLENMDAEANLDAGVQKKTDVAHTNSIALDLIEINPFQPRADFDAEALKELSASIKIHGVIQPVTVRQLDDGKYQLISGERRVRAAKLAGLREVPAYVRSANDQEMLEIALIENIQREDLNAVEIAIHLRRLLDECNLTHEQLAERVGKNRTTVTNFLRLLKLPPDIQTGLKKKEVTVGHARALINLEDPIGQLTIYRDIISKGLSVRETEDLVRSYQKRKIKHQKTAAGNLPYAIKKLQDELASQLGTRVIVRRSMSGKGEIRIAFFSDDDLFRIKDLMD